MSLQRDQLEQVLALRSLAISSSTLLVSLLLLRFPYQLFPLSFSKTLIK